MIHGNKVNIFQCVTVNNGDGKEEASEGKELRYLSDDRYIQNIGTLS